MSLISIVYHVTVLETFRPHISSNKACVSQFLDFTPFPDAIFASSIKQLKGIILEYKAEHQSANNTIFWACIGLMPLANAVLKDLANPDWRFFFLLCIRSFQQLFPAFPICEGIVQGLLAMAVQLDAISAQEARLILEEFRQGGDFHAATVHVKRAFVLEYDLAVKDKKLAAVETWVSNFEEIHVLSEFTVGIV